MSFNPTDSLSNATTVTIMGQEFTLPFATGLGLAETFASGTFGPQGGRSAARFMDKDGVHCIGHPRRLIVQGTVFINQRLASTFAAPNTPHLRPASCPVCCTIHSAPLIQGSSTVFIGSLPAGRWLDRVSGCTYVASGSMNVFIGG